MDKKYKLNAIFSILFVFLSSIFGIIKIPIVISTFGHYENGYYTQLMSISVMFNVVDAGISSILNATVTKLYFQRNFEKFNVYFSMARRLYNYITFAAIILLSIISIVLPLIEKSYVYHNSYVNSVIYIFIILLPMAMYFFKSHYLILVYCYKQAMIVEATNCLNGAIWLIAILLSKFIFGHMFEVVIITTILSLINNFFWKYYFYKKAKRDNLLSNLKVKVDKELIRASKYSSILVVFSNISRGLNFTLIAHFWGSVILSEYSSIMNYISGINLVFVNTLLNVTYNTFLELDALPDKTKINQAIKTHTILQQFVVVIVCSGMLTFFPSFLRIVGFMNPKTDLMPYIVIAIIEMYMWWTMMRFNHLAYIRKEFKRLVLPFTITTIINIVISIICTKVYGPYGVLIGSIVQWILMYWFLIKLVYSQILNDFLRILKGLILIFVIYFSFTKIVNLNDLYNIHSIFPYIFAALFRVILFTLITSILYICTERILIKAIKLFITEKLLKKLNK